MSLADRLNRLADEVDARTLPDVDEIRIRGQRIQRRQRTRFSVSAAALAVVAIAAATAIITLSGGRAAPPQPAGPIDGWRVSRTLHVPGNGVTFSGGGSLWVVDMKNQELTGDTPVGTLYQIDPRSGRVLDRIPGAVGGWPTVGGGSIWLCTAAGEVDALTRVDLTTHQLTRVPTSSPRQLPHGTALAAGNLWVANWATGDLVRLDPKTGHLRQTLHLGKGGSGQAPGPPVSDGNDVWVADNDGLVTRFDGATGRAKSTLQLPSLGVGLDSIDTARHVLYAQSRESIFEISTDPAGPDQLNRELAVTPDRLDVTIAGLAIGTGSLWAVTLNPDELLRIDPNTLTVTGRMPLTGTDHRSNVPIALTADDASIWVRLKDTVLQLSPDR